MRIYLVLRKTPEVKLCLQLHLEGSSRLIVTYRLSWRFQICFHQHLAKGLVRCNATHNINSRLSHSGCYKYALVQGLCWQLCGDLNRPQSQAHKLHGTCSGHFDESQTLFGFGHMLAVDVRVAFLVVLPNGVLQLQSAAQRLSTNVLMTPWWGLGGGGG